jgi:prepilin-type N-terminal cleavage/methylation domain-containing protein
MHPAARRATRAFTLIELLAVLFIMTLVLGITLPNLSLRTNRAALAGAEDLGARLGFARQRAVATGSPHRLVLDLDAGAYWLESIPEPPPPEAALALAPLPPGVQREVSLSAPPPAQAEFVPLAGPFGRPRPLPDDVFVTSVETLAAGAVSSGQIALEFAPDGSADPAHFVIENEDGAVMHVELARLADEVRIYRE